jgi:hypothetical protein
MKMKTQLLTIDAKAWLFNPTISRMAPGEATILLHMTLRAYLNDGIVPPWADQPEGDGTYWSVARKFFRPHPSMKGYVVPNETCPIQPMKGTQ